LPERPGSTPLVSSPAGSPAERGALRQHDRRGQQGRAICHPLHDRHEPRRPPDRSDRSGGRLLCRTSAGPSRMATRPAQDAGLRDRGTGRGPQRDRTRSSGSPLSALGCANVPAPQLPLSVSARLRQYRLLWCYATA
jgi:hypothetical protein